MLQQQRVQRRDGPALLRIDLTEFRVVAQDTAQCSADQPVARLIGGAPCTDHEAIWLCSTV
jgi:hypothetical protein